MSWETILVFVIVLWAVGKGWRFFIEVSEEFKTIRILEPWFWFFFLNIFLTFVTGSFEYRFLYLGLLLQGVLCAWFAVSLAWIIQVCPHKHCYAQPSVFIHGKHLRFCLRCGTRLPREIHSNPVKINHPSLVFFQVPPSLLKYVLFWMFHALSALMAVFIAMRMLKKPDLQNDVAVGALVFIVLLPLVLFFWGRLKRSLTRKDGLIWWEDIRGYGLVLIIIAVIFFIVIQWIGSS